MKKILIIVFVSLLFLSLKNVTYADTYATDFETFNLGTVNNQDGWTDLFWFGGIANVSSQNVYQIFGAKSFRVWDGAMRTFSKPLLDEAGETNADNAGFPLGSRKAYFSAEWDFASADPSISQPGISVSARMDRGEDGGKGNGIGMSMVTMKETSNGFNVDIEGGNALTTSVASGLDTSLVHHIKLTIDFQDGPNNDLVTVCVDDNPDFCKIVSTYESLYSLLGMQVSTVRGILFFSNAYNNFYSNGGMLIDNLKYSSGYSTISPSTKEDCKNDGWKAFNDPVFKNQGDCVSYMQSSSNAIGNKK